MAFYSVGRDTRHWRRTTTRSIENSADNVGLASRYCCRCRHRRHHCSRDNVLVALSLSTTRRERRTGLRLAWQLGRLPSTISLYAVHSAAVCYSRDIRVETPKSVRSVYVMFVHRSSALPGIERSSCLRSVRSITRRVAGRP